MTTRTRSRRRCRLCGRIRRLADLVELRVDAVVRHQLGEWQPKRPELLPPGSVVCSSHERRDSLDQVAAAVPLVSPIEFRARSAAKRIATEVLVAASGAELTLGRITREPARGAIAAGLARLFGELELDQATRDEYSRLALQVTLEHLELLAALEHERANLAPILEAAIELGVVCARAPRLERELQKGLPATHAIAKRAARDLEAALHRGALTANSLAELRMLLRILEDGAAKLVECWRELTEEGPVA